MAMAVEENAGGGSPRISFSHDLYLCDVVPIEQRPPRSRSKNSSLEFNFCVGAAAHDSSPADQLFSDGKLLPKEIINNKNRSTIYNDAAPSDANAAAAAAAAAFDNSSSSADLGDSMRIARDETGEDDEEKAQGGSKSFWRFGRSSSLNCGSSYGRALCPLPPLLSRSNSTGSASTKEKLKHCRPAARPPINKNAGVRVPPVLNVPSSNLFGLTSIFLNARDKRRRK